MFSLDDLVKENYIKEVPLDPLTEEKFNGSIKIYVNDNRIKYEYSNEECNKRLVDATIVDDENYDESLDVGDNTNEEEENKILLSDVILEDNPVIEAKATVDKMAVSQEYYNSLPTIGVNLNPGKNDAVVENGLYFDRDEDGNTYYFRGHVENNYVKFAGIMWRIVRINGDKSIRLIANEAVGKSKYTENLNLHKYAGYTYDNSSENSGDGTPNTIKLYLDEWYRTNLMDYDDIIVESRYCNDTKINTTSSSYKYYGIFSNNWKKGMVRDPSFICPETDELYGGKYKLKIGMLSLDEAIYAGMARGLYATEIYNPDCYLTHRRLSSIMLMSPRSSRSDAYASFGIYSIIIAENTAKLGYKFGENENDITPVINLSPNVGYLSGE